jgi:hypothetical protein
MPKQREYDLLKVPLCFWQWKKIVYRYNREFGNNVRKNYFVVVIEENGDTV